MYLHKVPNFYDIMCINLLNVQQVAIAIHFIKNLVLNNYVYLSYGYKNQNDWIIY